MTEDFDWKLLMEHRLTVVETAVLQWAKDVATIKWLVGIVVVLISGAFTVLVIR